MVQSGVAAPERSGAFMNVIRGQYVRADPSDRISTAVMLVSDGLVVGVARRDESATQLPPPKKKGIWASLFGGQDN